MLIVRILIEWLTGASSLCFLHPNLLRGLSEIDLSMNMNKFLWSCFGLMLLVHKNTQLENRAFGEGPRQVGMRGWF